MLGRGEHHHREVVRILLEQLGVAGQDTNLSDRHLPFETPQPDDVPRGRNTTLRFVQLRTRG